MPRLFRENPSYFIVPIFFLIIVAVFFFAERGSQAKEWERLASPTGFTQGKLSDITAVYDAQNSRYLLYAVGGGFKSGVPHTNGLLDVPTVFSYDSQAATWIGKQVTRISSPIGIETKLNAISNFDPLSGYLYAVGNWGAVLLKIGGSDWQILHSINSNNTCVQDPIDTPGLGTSFTQNNLTDVSYYNKYIGVNLNTFAWATGEVEGGKGRIYRTKESNSLEGCLWEQDKFEIASGPPDFPFLGIQMFNDNTGWAVGADLTIYHYIPQAPNTPPYKWNKYTGGLPPILSGSCVSGFCDNTRWACSTADPIWENNCTVDFQDVFFTDENHGWIPISNKRYLYYDGSWSLRLTGRPDSEPETKMYAVSGGLNNGVPYIWFTGEAGMTIFAPNANNDHWLRQATPDLGIGRLNGISSLDSTHAWAAGHFQSATPGQLSDNAALRLSSGNASGYAYIGADNCENFCVDAADGDCQAAGCSGQPRQAPFGWASFNCVNKGSCESNPFTYGVDLKKEIAATPGTCNGITCSNNSAIPCTSDIQCSPSCVDKDPVNFQDKDVGALSGQAWLGVQDPKEQLASATCDLLCEGGNNPGGSCFTDVDCLGTPDGECLGHCSNNSSLACSTDDECALCGTNPKSCFSAGWLSFNRTETGDPTDCPYIFSAGDSGCDDWEANNQIKTPCDKIISKNDYESNALAFFNYQTYALQGWGRFKLGQCRDHQNYACYNNSGCKFCNGGINNGSPCLVDGDCSGASCAPYVCDYKNKDRNNDPAKGWLKLRGGINYSSSSILCGLPPLVEASKKYIYHNCNACLVNDNMTSALKSDDYMTCKICQGLNIDTVSSDPSCNLASAGQNYSCNKCEGPYQCGDGRCSLMPEKTCIVLSNQAEMDYCEDTNLHPGGWGTCVPSGYCSSGSTALYRYRPCAGNGNCGGGICQRGYCSGTVNPCYNDTDCLAFGVSCEIQNPVTCNQCDSCDAYGVSADINAGNFYGYAWSEDFGWVDMSRVTLGGEAWLQTLYGDIYSQQNVGTTDTAKAPGYGNAAGDCNATYLILAGDQSKIVNFCTSSPAPLGNTLTNPSIGSPQTGTTNPWLVEQYRKFTLPNSSAPNSILGRVDYNNIRCDSTNTGDLSINDSYFFGNPIDLNGQTFCIRKSSLQSGDLTLSSDFIFKNGSIDGTGLFVVDGDLIIQGDINYATAGVDNLKKLASVGFYVKGDIHISPSVSTLVGAYYSEKTIYTESMGSADKPLNVYGLMIAKKFVFGRRHKGNISKPEPSEVIEYDGRVQLNPPPGFRDLSKALPKITEVYP